MGGVMSWQAVALAAKYFASSLGKSSGGVSYKYVTYQEQNYLWPQKTDLAYHSICNLHILTYFDYNKTCTRL